MFTRVPAGRILAPEGATSIAATITPLASFTNDEREDGREPSPFATTFLGPENQAYLAELVFRKVSKDAHVDIPVQPWCDAEVQTLKDVVSDMGDPGPREDAVLRHVLLANKEAFRRLSVLVHSRVRAHFSNERFRATGYKPGWRDLAGRPREVDKTQPAHDGRRRGAPMRGSLGAAIPVSTGRAAVPAPQTFSASRVDRPWMRRRPPVRGENPDELPSRAAAHREAAMPTRSSSTIDSMHTRALTSAIGRRDVLPTKPEKVLPGQRRLPVPGFRA